MGGTGVSNCFSTETPLRVRVEPPKSLGPEPPLCQSLSIAHDLVTLTCDIRLALDFIVTCSEDSVLHDIDCLHQRTMCP